MDYRKLISFGKGGFVVSVPKNWIVENKLQKGAIIGVDQRDNQIVLSPQHRPSTSLQNSSPITIELDSLSAPAALAALTNAYLNSNSTITIKGKNLPALLPQIKNHIHNSIALEIIDSEKNLLVVKDYLNFSDVSITSIFRKMDMGIRSIFTDIKSGSDQSTLTLRLNEINRHFYLLLKSINKAALDHSLLKNFGCGFADLVQLRDHTFYLKSISDQLEEFVQLQTNELDEKCEATLQELIVQVEAFYLSVLKSLHKKEQATDLHEMYPLLQERIKTFQEVSFGKKKAPLLAEKLRCIAKSTHDLLRGAR